VSGRIVSLLLGAIAIAGAAFLGGALGLVLGVAGGVVVGLAAAGRPPALTPPWQRVTPHLLPEPALAWLRHAHDALGAWAIEGDGRSPGMAGYQSIDPAGGLTGDRIEMVERRLLEVRGRDGGGGERLDVGTLVYEAFAGFVAGILLRPGHSPGALDAAHRDLRHLLDGLTRRPIIHELAQAQAAPFESPKSVCLRLAYHVERILNASTVVAVVEPLGVRVIAVSGGADHRMVDMIVPDESPLGRVARGEARSNVVRGLGPAAGLGLPLQDRRDQSRTQVQVLNLQDQGMPLGALAFWRVPSGPFPGPALAEVRQLCHQAEPRLRAAVEAAKNLADAQHDPLTGLPNRRELERRINDVSVEAGSLVVLDLDRFKELNDTLGHPAGDAALIHMARVLQREVRGPDVAARIGGEEFAVWLPTTSLADASSVAERIRKALLDTPWDWRGRVWPVTASFGVAGCPETSKSKANLMAQADRALYAAKDAGRDRVMTAAAAG